jgi:hypothetical protein
VGQAVRKVRNTIAVVGKDIADQRFRGAEPGLGGGQAAG